MDWSAAQYLKFEGERSRPARDLINALPDIAPRRIYDLGCGPGNSTELLKARFPDAELTGIELDDDMLEKARARMPDTAFEKADLVHWNPSTRPDLLFSNAVFQWVPNHIAVLQRLAASLAPGGALALQMPDNLSEPSHVAMVETAREGPWADAFDDSTSHRRKLPAPSVYYEALRRHCAKVDIFHIIYHHPLPNAEAIVEWVKGTGLRPYLERIPAHDRPSFVAAYAKRIARNYPVTETGEVLLRFQRLFIVAC
ncbi:trans-aconitate 2-methyltransferase [Martelella soudanensis]|uniref:trans-aconitate 2-methyltransferase n=1 Tax=unclassified Martelella TaxID=2629616 RepID=UPI0015E03C26|nr:MULTISPECIES: trans-aconitate 2-methyltransferase [unclassified Martelella]